MRNGKIEHHADCPARVGGPHQVARLAELLDLLDALQVSRARLAEQAFRTFLDGGGEDEETRTEGER